MQICDVLVIGGGPAGSTVASFLADKGWKVELLEKAHHPRFHIGESLLPMNLAILERLGVLDQVGEIGEYKPGAEFGTEQHLGPPLRFNFGRNVNGSPPHAYQVRRSEFDHLLLRNSAGKGVNVREGTRVTKVDLSADLQCLEAVDDTGAVLSFQARLVVDASGRDALMSGRLGMKEKNHKHGSAALFGHFHHVERSSAPNTGNIGIYWFAHGWFWMIPLKDGTMSVGAVCDPTYLKSRKSSPESFLQETIALCPPVQHRMRAAKPASGVQATGNYSYFSKRMHGEGFVLVGDAFAFIDPVFSSGVYIAMHGAERAAQVIDANLRDLKRDPAAAKQRLRALEREMRCGIAKISWLIYRFNTPALRRLFMSEPKPPRIEAAVISVLAGDVFDNPRLHQPYALFKLVYYLNACADFLGSLKASRRLRDNAQQTFVDPPMVNDSAN